MPFFYSGYLLDPGIKPGSLALQVDSLPTEPDRGRCVFSETLGRKPGGNPSILIMQDFIPVDGRHFMYM